MRRMLRRMRRQARYRLPRANPVLLVAGLGCVLAALGLGLNLGGVEVATPATWWQQVLAAGVGLLLLVLSLVVGVKVDGVKRPPGGFFGARPYVPTRFVPRPAELGRLIDALLRADGQVVAVVGMGGVGKTVLAAKAANERRLHRRFADGVAWLAVDEHTDDVAVLTMLARRLGVSNPAFTTVDQGRDLLAGLLAERDILLVLDNVWHPALLHALRDLTPGCTLLITTRHGQLAQAADAIQLQVAALTPEQAVALLGRWTDHGVDQLPAEADEICDRLEYLALGIAMAGAMIGKAGQSWEDVLRLLDTADLEQISYEFGPEYPHPTLLAAIQLSIENLPDELTRQRYRELVVFAGRSPFPGSAVEALWASAGLSKSDARGLLTLFEGRSLLFAEGSGWYWLHDLQVDVIHKQLRPERLVQMHNQLLDGYQARSQAGWPGGPNDGYFLENLTAHLAQAGRADELATLLTDLTWLHTKLAATGPAGLVTDFAHHPSIVVARAVRLAVQLSADALAAAPDQLPGQLVGRLGDHPDPTVQALADAIRAWDVSPWLCPLTPALTPAAGPQQHILYHTAPVKAVAVSPNGQLVISGGGDGTVYVWELASGRRIRTRTTFRNARVVATAISPDGRLVVSGSEDGAVAVWNLASGRRVHALRRKPLLPVWPFRRWKRLMTVIVVNPDGRLAVAGDLKGTVRAWLLRTGKLISTTRTNNDLGIDALAVSLSGELVTDGLGQTVEVRRLGARGAERILRGHKVGVDAVAVTPDGSRIISGDVTGEILVWDRHSYQPVGSLSGHTGTIHAVGVSPDGQLVASGGGDKTVRVWRLETGQPIGTLIGHAAEVNAVAFSPDGQLVISGSKDHTVRVWEATSVRQAHTQTGPTSSVRALAVSPDGRLMISAEDVSDVRVWEVASGQPIRTRRLIGAKAVAVSRDGRLVISGGTYPLTVWDITSGKVLPLPGELNGVDFVLSIAACPDGRIVTSRAADPTVQVWNLATGKLERVLSGHTDVVTTVAVSPDGQLVASAGLDKTVRVWSLETGQSICTLTGHAAEVNTVALSHDGQRVISGSEDSIVRVWEVASGQPVGVLSGHTGPVDSVAVSPDGRLVISGSKDRTLRVWVLSTGRELARWSGERSISACAVVPTRLLTIAVGEAAAFGEAGRGAVYTLQLRGVQDAHARSSEHERPHVHGA